VNGASPHVKINTISGEKQTSKYPAKQKTGPCQSLHANYSCIIGL